MLGRFLSDILKLLMSAAYPEDCPVFFRIAQDEIEKVEQVKGTIASIGLSWDLKTAVKSEILQ